VSQLYDLKLKIEAKIKADGLDGNEVRGKIGLKSGKLLALINPMTPDDPAGIAKLRQAINDVLGLSA
jgi:hypothetical protein